MSEADALDMYDERPIRVAVVDDQPLVLTSLVSALGREGRLDVVGACSGIEPLDRLLSEQAVDVVLLDVHLGAVVVDAALYGDLCRRFPMVRFVFLSGREPDRSWSESPDYVAKGAPLAEVADAVVQAAGRG